MRRATILAIVMVAVTATMGQAQNNTTAGFQSSTIPGHLPGNLLGSIPACQVSLNRWNLMAWNGIVPDRHVGGSEEKVETEAGLKELKDEYVAACAADGHDMMAATRTRMEETHRTTMAEWDDFWGAWARRWVTDIHNGHLAEMTKWYQESIRSCQQHFTSEFNALRGQLCG